MAIEQVNTKRPLAVVTGASSGIGYELAKVFAKNGFDLVVAAEDSGIEKTGKELQQLGAEVETVQIDLASDTGVDQLYTRIKSLGRPVDAAALNAGVGVSGAFAKNDLKPVRGQSVGL
ncbi:SDR family NAD(P)-dependent oxidoreductase [bacterium]|nr:MAG: SDR family NAD(P)-dependent oxidoreductase [bacterium]